MLKEYKSSRIRNVAIIGHGSTGKSTLFDAMLFVGGKISRIGSAESGTLTSDFDEDEKTRKMSIRSSMGFIEVDDVKINIIDTPGLSDFIGEARAAIQVVDGVIIVLDSVDGVQIETEKAWRYLSENNIPGVFFINKMDKERASFQNVIESIKAGLNARVAPLCLPDGEGESFKGVVDIIEMKALRPKGDGKDVTVTDIPNDMKDIVDEERNNLIEMAAEGDDAYIEKFLEGEALTKEELMTGIRNQVKDVKLYPLVCGSAGKAVGVKNLVNIVKNFIPSPDYKTEYAGLNPDDTSKEIVVKSYPEESFSAVVWKTYIDQYAGRFNYLKIISGELLPDTDLFNSSKNAKERISKIFSMTGDKQEDVPKLTCGDIGVVVKLEKTATGDTLCDSKKRVLLSVVNLPHPVFSYAIEPAKKGDEDKIGQIFAKITDENPTITYQYNSETRQTVLSGMGEMQLDIILKSLKERNKLELLTSEPRVAYRETITRKAEAKYRHKKQTGGHGQFGEVFIRIEPRERGAGFEFKDSIVGGVIPRQYITGVEKGLVEGMQEGVIAKYPVVDVWVELFDGSFHPVDSSEMSFKIAARHAFKDAMKEAGPHLLEPVMEVDVYVDSEYMGDVLNDVTSRRGKVLGMDSKDESQGAGVSVIKSQVPLAEMLRYNIDLRAMTSGKATFEMRFSHYDPISGRIADKVVEERKKQFEEESK